ncbi:MAG: substrate-binding domain-containing protein [Victivallales bacterium]|nr:substrate-binding domain-containing protein [Victivallales bacterium]
MNYIIKSLICAAVAGTCFLLANGCSKKTDAPGASTGGGAAATKARRIGISIPSADHGWTGGVVWWAERAKAELTAANPGLSIEIVTAKDSTEQVNQIETLLSKGIDALVVLPHEPGPLTNVCASVKENGALLVVVDRGLSRAVADIEVVGDNPGFGRVCGEQLVKALGGQGTVVVMEGVPCQVNSDRVEAFKAVMANYPNIQVLDSQPANWDTAQGLKVMEAFLQKYPKIDAVWTGDDDVLLGALKAYEESGRSDVKCFIGGGGNKLINKKVLDRDPLIPVNVTYPPKMIYAGVEEAIAALNGAAGDLPKKVVVPADVITPENAAEFYFPESIY